MRVDGLHPLPPPPRLGEGGRSGWADGGEGFSRVALAAGPTPLSPPAPLADARSVPADTSTGRPTVAIVTVNYNSAAYIEPFLASLRAVESPPFQLVIYDCASRDGSPELIECCWPGAVVLRGEENIGFTGGNNRAIAWALAAGYRWLLFLNNDTEVTPDFLTRLLARADERTLVAPRVELLGSDGLLDDTAGDFDWRRGVWRDWLYGKLAPPAYQVEREVEMASLCCLLVPASVFRHAGLLDERLFMYYEDFDFIKRAQSAGYRVRYLPEACVYHRKSAAAGGDSPFRQYYATRNRVAILRRHQTGRQFARFSLDFALTRLARAAQQFAAGRPDLARALLLGWRDAYLGRMGKRWPAPGEQERE